MLAKEPVPLEVAGPVFATRTDPPPPESRAHTATPKPATLMSAETTPATSSARSQLMKQNAPASTATAAPVAPPTTRWVKFIRAHPRRTPTSRAATSHPASRPLAVTSPIVPPPRTRKPSLRDRPFPGGRSLVSQATRTALKTLTSSDRFSIAEAVERAVGYLYGPPLPEWEYLCVNLTLDDAPPVDIGGWQLA